ncbi:MAG: Rid family detoxifying hydrolase [Planctomycetota bacterium]|jgi:reactive intermediate/imine deaminase|nr:Rid family detoxifying hydrolase [Planctomycetota bacterium]
MKKEIRTSKAPPPGGPYSQGLLTGKTIYVAGQTPRQPVTGTLPEGIGAQTRQALQNVKAIVEAGGGRMDEVAKVTVHLADLSDFPEFNEAYKEFFSEPYPVRTTVQSGLSGFLVEIDAVAEID